MTITFPTWNSKLSQPVTTNNFTPIQSVQITVSNSGASGSQSKTFTAVPGGATRTTLKITNSGTKGCYVSTGIGSATAVLSSGTPTPTAGMPMTATCDYISPGSIITQDYIALTDTVAAICAGTDTTTLEISIGYGQ